MLAVSKSIVFESVCRAQNIEVQPQDYGFAEWDYESLYRAVAIDGKELCMVNEDGTDFLDEKGQRVWLHDQCYVGDGYWLAKVWSSSYQAINAFADDVDVAFRE